MCNKKATLNREIEHDLYAKRGDANGAVKFHGSRSFYLRVKPSQSQIQSSRKKNESAIFNNGNILT